MQRCCLSWPWPRGPIPLAHLQVEKSRWEQDPGSLVLGKGAPALVLYPRVL